MPPSSYLRPLLPLLLVLSLGACGASGTSDDAGGPGGDDNGSETTGGDDASSAETVDAIDIVDYEYKPKAATVEMGKEVTWTNQDDFAHNVVPDKGDSFKSQDSMAKGDTFTHTFDEKGTFTYKCGIHNYMTATITVV